MVEDEIFLKDSSTASWLGSFREAALHWVDGHIRVDSIRSGLPSSLHLLSLREASVVHSTFFEEQKGRVSREEGQNCEEGQTFLEGDSLFLHVPRGVKVEVPLRLLFMAGEKGKERPSSRPFVYLSMEEESELHLLLTAFASEEGFVAFALQGTLGRGAVLSTEQLTLGGKCGSGTMSLILHEESQWQALCVSKGNSHVIQKSSHLHHRALMVGRGAEARVTSLGIFSGEEKWNHSISMEHRAPSCLSRQLVKSVVDDRASICFTGRIRIEREGEKGDGEQLSRTLLLSDSVRVQARPYLEIFAEDVRASHGSTVGMIDEEQELYLRSRGVDRPSARRLLIHGFCREILDSFVHMHRFLGTSVLLDV